MNFADILRLCVQNLFRRKSRTILTVLGVIVGCCSIVLMVSFGQGINEQNERSLKAMGDLSIVTAYTSGGGYGMAMASGGSSSSGGSGSVKLDDKAIESFRSIAGVEGVTPVKNLQYTATAKAGAGGRYIDDGVQIMGIDMSQLDAMGLKLTEGDKPVNEKQILAGEHVVYGFMDSLRNGAMRSYADGSCTYSEATGQCVPTEGEDPYFNLLTTPITLVTGANYQGDPYVQNLYSGGAAGMAGGASGAGASGADGQSQNVTLDFTVTGVLKGDYNKGYATTDGFVMDLKVMQSLLKKIDPSSAAKSMTYDQALVKVADLSQVPVVESQLKAMGYETSSYEDLRKSMEEGTRVIQLILGGIGAVSLLVAAIGIANTMVMSVSERTREIGIMKALGCYVRDIRVMFLTEAGAIGFFGGVIGAALSAFVSLGINVGGMWLSSMSSSSSDGSGSGGGASFGTMVWQAIVGGEDVTRYSVIPWWLYLFAILFATCVGLLFGFGPANKAVKIPALDAIKNEQ
ncbi:ABC transporter permease [Bifidobacterium callitrichos]|uniref:Permease protein of ABC transporter system n=1 Tax=Bifidobacterium callitrichos DSM 23973 TaxID=1437609 RepID=A0A087ACB4_9BIFI|nr:ABC transporter permease [Bifidobacterium callitrichos]KFI56414.1 Permease protein of ABC transporter system [Bifidobacterium callitrichos DSM 23973]